MNEKSMPLLDRAVYRVVGDMMRWLGARAHKRGDRVLLLAMRDALRVGHVEGRLKNKEQS